MKNSINDRNGKEQLVRELKARLRWYQEEAAPEEMDVDEISGILALLEQLAPLEDNVPGKEEAYRKFEEQYIAGAEPAEAAERSEEAGKIAEMEKPHRGNLFWKNRAVRYAVTAAAVILLLFSALNIGTYAATKKGFFEFIRQEKGGKSFFVNGDAGEGMGTSVSGTRVYDSWGELTEEMQGEIYVPTYIPEGLCLESLMHLTENYTDIIKATYLDEMSGERLEVSIEKYGGNYTWQQTIQKEAILLAEKKIGERVCSFYEYLEERYLYFFVENKLYTVFGNLTVDELEKIAEGMQILPESP